MTEEVQEEPEDIRPTPIEVAYAQSFAEHIVQRAAMLTELEVRRSMFFRDWLHPLARLMVINEMRSQMAADAMKTGLGVLAMADPAYRLQPYMGLRHSDETRRASEWGPESDIPRHIGGNRDLVEIRVDAVAVPILLREA